MPKKEHEKYYAQIDAQGKKFIPKPVKRYCWKMETTIRFREGVCMMEGCPYRNSTGCLQKMI